MQGSLLRHEVRITLTKDEMERFSAFLEKRGAKKGPFVRQLLLRVMAEAEISERPFPLRLP